MHTLPTIAQVRRDLVAHLYGLSNILDSSVRPGAGAAMLGLSGSEKGRAFPRYDDFSLESFPLANGLESIYRYAAFGEVDTIFHMSLDPEDFGLGSLQLLKNIFLANPEVSFCLDVATRECDEPENPRGGFREMVSLAVARAHLDDDRPLSVSEVALLAGISERTVANAMAGAGENRLIANRNARDEVEISTADAKAWLQGRRAYVKSVWVRSIGELPELCSAADLSSFLSARIVQEVSDERLDTDVLASTGEVRHLPGQRLLHMCRALGWPEVKAKTWLEGRVDNLNPDDANGIARLMLVDARWLRKQVLKWQSKEGLPREAEDGSKREAAPWAGSADHTELETVLTDAGIRHGYFDLEQRYARRFFPEDAFGGRSSEELGKPVRLHFGGQTCETDIRVKSQAQVSPRRRFTSYFKAQQAKPGDRLRVTRLGDREYQISFTDERGQK